MNIKFFKQSSVVLGITTLNVSMSGPSAQVQGDSNAASAKEANVVTSAAVLNAELSANVVAQVQSTYPTTEPTTPTTEPPTTAPETTPTEPATGAVEPGRATRGGSSYVGIGGNIGLGGGKTALGLGNFTVISKIGLTDTVSARPSVIIGDNTAILIPVTYDFNLQPTGAETEAISSFSPYVGGGLAISTGDNDDVGPMLTAGADVPLAEQITATAGVNVGFFDDTSVGLVIGVGYNFTGF